MKANIPKHRDNSTDTLKSCFKKQNIVEQYEEEEKAEITVQMEGLSYNQYNTQDPVTKPGNMNEIAYHQELLLNLSDEAVHLDDDSDYQKDVDEYSQIGILGADVNILEAEEEIFTEKITRDNNEEEKLTEQIIPSILLQIYHENPDDELECQESGHECIYYKDLESNPNFGFELLARCRINQILASNLNNSVDFVSDDDEENFTFGPKATQGSSDEFDAEPSNHIEISKRLCTQDSLAQEQQSATMYNHERDQYFSMNPYQHCNSSGFLPSTLYKKKQYVPDYQNIASLDDDSTAFEDQFSGGFRNFNEADIQSFMMLIPKATPQKI
eukprot:403359755